MWVDRRDMTRVCWPPHRRCRKLQNRSVFSLFQRVFSFVDDGFYFSFEIKESYNVDLLETGGPTTHVIDPGLTTNNPTGQSGVNGANKEISYSSVANRSRRGEAYGEEERYFHHHRRPWLRRPVGLVTLAIIFIIIVGAIVGGAVGGTVGHHKNDSSAQQQQQQQGFGPTSAGNGSAQQGVGPSTSSSNGNATQGTSPQEQNVGGTPPNK